MATAARAYNNPPTTPSGAGPQLTEHYYQKKALIELVKEQYFTQLASVESMPKHMGKKIKRYVYVPMLDDANFNDQGIDATGATIANGNLYGSSKDVGTISGKLPVLGEHGGRVNRVGFTRKTLEGTFENFGMFREYTEDSVDFDSDEALEEHSNREMLRGANEINEDALQVDLLNGAGTVRYPGAAMTAADIDKNTVVTYGDLMRLSIDLDNNRTPKSTKVITGSRMIDTRTISGGRVMYVGSELIPTLRAMVDGFNQPAFIPVEKYGAAGTILNGEIGAIDAFRIVVVPEMQHWANAGKPLAGETEYHGDTNYDVFPMLVVGDESFTTIGFQTDGKSVKFKILSKKPGEATADRNDPYGKTGWMSIQWWYGFMALRPERIALIKTAAKL